MTQLQNDSVPSVKGAFTRLLRYGLRYRRLLIQALVLLSIAIAGSVLGPFLIKVFIDDYLTPRELALNPLLALAVVYIVGQIISAIAFFQQAIRFNTIALNVVQTIREEVFAKVMRLPLSFFDHTPTGSLVSRITNDTEAIKDLYVNVISVFIQNAIRILGILIAMAILDVKLMLIAAMLVPMVAVLMVTYQKLSTPVFQRVRSLLSDINARLNEGIQGMSVIQIMNQQGRFTNTFRDTSTHHYRMRLRNVMIDGFMLRALVDLFYMAILAVLLFSFGIDALTLEGAVQIGVIYAFLNYLGSMTEPVVDMTSRLNMFQQALVSASRVFKLLDEESEQEPTEPQVPTSDRLVFQIPSFSYDGQKTVLRDIELTVEPGQFVGIVGHTGSGKSTLMSLLMSFYPVPEGQVTLGGVPLNQVASSVRTRRLGLVQQDPFIFMGTIADNIRLDLDISDADIEAAARQAQLHDAIMALPNGYQTELAERGGNLSNGQRQLLSLARTLARKPSILILDEATANIDSETEALVQRSLMLLRGQITILAIAHRLSTVKDADVLLVLHQGEIQQRGTHRALMTEEGLYKHMYQLQQQTNPLVD
ncbi:MAG: ATP-binding cassette domain-containing protein [Natronospirillum sp.]